MPFCIDNMMDDNIVYRTNSLMLYKTITFLVLRYNKSVRIIRLYRNENCNHPIYCQDGLDSVSTSN